MQGAPIRYGYPVPDLASFEDKDKQLEMKKMYPLQLQGFEMHPSMDLCNISMMPISMIPVHEGGSIEGMISNGMIGIPSADIYIHHPDLGSMGMNHINQFNDDMGIVNVNTGKSNKKRPKTITPEMKKQIQEKNRLAQRKYRASMDAEKRLVVLEKNRVAHRVYRESLPEEIKKDIKEKNRIAQKRRRLEMTPDERKQIQEKNREAQKRRRLAMSSEEKTTKSSEKPRGNQKRRRDPPILNNEGSDAEDSDLTLEDPYIHHAYQQNSSSLLGDSGSSMGNVHLVDSLEILPLHLHHSLHHPSIATTAIAGNAMNSLQNTPYDISVVSDHHHHHLLNMPQIEGQINV